MSSPDRSAGCALCRNSEQLPFGFSYAFQPIVDIAAHSIFAHEALVRGPQGESAQSVLSQVVARNQYSFDQACREKAIRTAASLQMPSHLSINFLPNAIYRPEVCVRSTLDAARRYGLPIQRIIFETVEGEKVDDGEWLAEILTEYKRIGFKTAIDDFGAGFAGLNLLADFQLDIVKLDMALIQGVDRSPSRRAIIAGVVAMCGQLSIDVIAEGVETADEARCLSDLGIRLMQGYWFARPRFEATVAEADILWSE